MDLLGSVQLFWPEIFLSGGILVLLFVQMVRRAQRRGDQADAFLVTLGILLITLLLVRFQYSAIGLEGVKGLFSGMIANDPFAIFFKMLLILSTIIVVGITFTSRQLCERRMGEYAVMILSMLVGMMLMASATNLLMIFLSVELTSIASYVLAGYLRDEPRSNEAALKYVVYGAFSTGLMLFGFSILYGLSGSLDLYAIHEVLRQGGGGRLTLFVSLLLVLAGIGYKIAFVPFHFWVPDVYEGAPIPVGAYLSIAPKAAGVALFLRFLVTTFGGVDALDWTLLESLNFPMLLGLLAAVTMTIGNLMALPQQNLKRLLGYSSIAHMGYVMIGIAVFTEAGSAAALFYTALYLFMNLGAFHVVTIVANRHGESIASYKGLVWRAPLIAVPMMIFLFALTGIPPTAGFVGKLYLFAEAIEVKMYWLALIGALNSVISLYYYARVVKAMVEPLSGEEHSPRFNTLDAPVWSVTLLFALVVPTLFLGIYWEPLKIFAHASLQMALH